MARIRLSKLERLAAAAFENGLRLHFDSIALFKKHSYASAFHLSVLAIEEFGKAYWIDHVVFYSTTGSRMSPEEEMRWIKMLYLHPEKQRVFADSERDWLPRSYIDMIEKRKLEEKKQGAIYAGFKRLNGNIQLHGPICTPFSMSASAPKKQITVVQKFLVRLIKGFLEEYLCVDNSWTEALLTKRLLNRVNKSWNITGSHIFRVRT